ncbi:hypothetical protein EXE58_01235 [Nocardioides seonyuensis]|uniref:DUF222 domain-containing protein n=1 Tax=Nocardioides seonyuensis TaxID=2518371 RepID=A0A4P7IB48_9ACTN|nr:hypothetical protein [Nocardioides seonyuensis]QBX54229.1 hypothetical protein EXE58_01235 [Nocardioides seonyuensis]
MTTTHLVAAPTDTVGATPVGSLVDNRELLEAAAAGVVARRLAEVAELEVAIEWVVRHGHPLPVEGGRRDPMVSPGGEGTPAVREYALPELAMARGEHTLRTRAMVADVLDLQHRLPLTWAKVRAGACDAWVGRRVAVLTRRLALEHIRVVDRAVAAAITGHAPSTVFEITAAKVMQADPETHAMERERERHRRYVTLSRADENGFRCVIARTTAGDAAWIDAMVDRVADILAAQHGHDHNRDELRSLAFGWLARPADLLKLLLDHTEPTQTSEHPVWAPAHLVQTVDRLASMSTRQLACLRGRGVVFVHLTDTSLLQQAGIARVEAQGPMLVQALSELLGHADVTMKPVLDHRIRRRVDAYEHPESLKDHVWTSTGGDVFPYAPRTATRASVDFDHARPFTPTDTGGPPGQTGPHNSGPLRRRHHRWKTHGGYRVRQAGPGRHLWQTPHGLCYLVDPTGTHRLDHHAADLILNAPPGCDIYVGPSVVLSR